jgi:hypothetical protein
MPIVWPTEMSASNTCTSRHLAYAFVLSMPFSQTKSSIWNKVLPLHIGVTICELIPKKWTALTKSFESYRNFAQNLHVNSHPFTPRQDINLAALAQHQLYHCRAHWGQYSQPMGIRIQVAFIYSTIGKIIFLEINSLNSHRVLTLVGCNMQGTSLPFCCWYACCAYGFVRYNISSSWSMCYMPRLPISSSDQHKACKNLSI